ncbi:MAG: cation-transporting P-type ATPase [Bdellovibrionales bacterium]|nr:cation-transporting P-type ATPase [Bdellovibrionales bacterium]
MKRTLKSTCFVIREGKTESIAIRELVPGDLLVLEEGQTLPADGVLLRASNLTIDESSLTGESVPVEKSVDSEALSGTTVLTGSGVAEIRKTGLNSQLGSIAKVLRDFESTPSPLLVTVRKSVRVLFLASLALGGLIFWFNLRHGHGLGESLIASLTLAMAAIPEEFPLVFTLYLSFAAYRLSKSGILVKSLPAVEGLGRVDVICTDKTGTLTEGKFLLESIVDGGGISETVLRRTLVFGCEPKAVDAMESSILEFATRRWSEADVEEVRREWELRFDYPFDPKAKYMCHVWRERTSGKEFLAMKGALEGVLARCGPDANRGEILKKAEALAASGKRLLGLAYSEGRFSGERAEDERNLRFIGILSFADPIRASVPAAIRECHARGVRLKMLTGDHLLTAHAIADAIRLPHSHDELFAGPDLEMLPAAERAIAYRKGAIFARLKPEQKLELVRALKDEGKIVAMTGDGVNDALALKLADVGISMGERATDVARSSAQMILMKNDFGGIVSAIVEGQRVLDSLRQSFGYLIAFHIPIIGIATIQALFLDRPILRPIHIVLLELIVHPVSAFVFTEGRAAGRKTREFVGFRKIVGSSIRGTLLGAVCLAAYFGLGGTEEYRGSIATLLLVLGNTGILIAEAGGILRIVETRSRRPVFTSLLLVLLGSLLVYVPVFSKIFSISRFNLGTFSLLAGIGFGLGLIVLPRE